MKVTLLNLNIFFILFYFNILISCFCIILVNNTIQSVFFLILVFCNSSGILLLLNCSFLAFLLIIIYVGAVAVLFLFVIMMLKITVSNFLFFESLYRYLPLAILINCLIIIEFLFIYFYNLNSNSFEFFLRSLVKTNFFINWFSVYFNVENIKIISNLIFDYFWLYLIVASIVLMVSMIGCIILSLNPKTINYKSQNFFNKFNLNLTKKIFLINKN